jgi:hypothetical protein
MGGSAALECWCTAGHKEQKSDEEIRSHIQLDQNFAKPKILLS